MIRTKTLARAALLLGAAALSACGDGTGGGSAVAAADSVPPEQRYGGTAVIGMIGDMPDVNPLTSTELTASQVQMYILFAPLLTYDEKLQPVPYAAESWEVNSDTTEITFHLRHDLYWHDGVKTTAEDWKFSYDLARNPKTAFPNASYWTGYGEATAVDSFTFRVKLKPHAEFLDAWRAFAAVPEHILKGVPPEQMKNNAFSTRTPVGNGPFRFVSRQLGQSWTFDANPDFPKSMGGRPYLDRVVIRVIPETTTLLTELLTGNIDFYVAPPPAQAARIKASDNARLIAFPDRSYVSINWNLRRDPFSDRRVRRALTLAIDRQSIVDGVVYGYGSVANSPVPPIFWQYDPQAGADLKYDPEQAKRLLAEAGWVDRDNDGILENAAGKEFRFQLLTNQGNQTRADILQVVQSDLAKVGIAVEPQILEWGTLLDRLNDPNRRDFDGVVIGWQTEFRMDDTDSFACDRRDGPFQWSGYCDPRTDQLLDTLPKIADRAASKPLWIEYQRKIAQDQPYTFLYFDQRLEGVNDRLRNVHPDARGDFVGLKNWWILPSRRGT